MTMKRTTMLFALAVLALPASAAAHDGHHRGHGHGDRHHHARVTASFAAKHAAFACKAERKEAGDDDFDDAWGDNENKRNAFGKCVSAKRERGLHARLFEVATGHMTSAGAPNCQFSDAGCTVTAVGEVGGLPVQTGTFSSTFTIDWKHARSNGDGGYCAKATGTTTLSDGSGSLVKTETGKLCEVGATGTNVEHVFFGKYVIDGAHSTGAYANAEGKGMAAFDQKPDGSIRAVELGGYARAS